MKVLVDNVAAQVIEACLLAPLPDTLSPTSILEMDAVLVTAIAGEPEESQMERDQLTRKLGVLRSGLDICKRYGSRPVPALLADGISASSSASPSVNESRLERHFSNESNGPVKKPGSEVGYEEIQAGSPASTSSEL